MPWALWGLGLWCLSIAVCFLSLDVDRNGAHLKNWCWQENIIMLLFESEYGLPLHPLQWIIIVHAEIPVYFFFGEDVWGISWYILFFRHSTGTVQNLLWKPIPMPWRNPKGQFWKSIPAAVKNSAWMTQMMKSSKTCQFLGIHLVKPTFNPSFLPFQLGKLPSRPVLFLGVQIIK